MDLGLGILANAFFITFLASVSFGILGTLVVVRRVSSAAGAISHSVLGGIGIGLFCERALGIPWGGPLPGAILAALVSALGISWVSLRFQQREDTVIGAIWAVGMAIGLLFLSKTPGYADPMSYLFGNILLVSDTDLFLTALLGMAVLGVVAPFYREILALCFDESFAKVRNIKTEMLSLCILLLVALATVAMLRLVGLILVIALLTLPAAIACVFPMKLWKAMIFAGVLCLLLSWAGIIASYFLDLPTGSSIAVLAGAAYLVAIGLKARAGRV